MGHHGEALRCARQIDDPARRDKTERALHAPGTPQAERHAERARRPGAAPAASQAGSRVDERDEPSPGAVEHLLDAGQYLMHQHMPWLVLTTMLAFPLIVGLGGFLTAGGSPFVLAAIAALPGLSVLVVVASMGHEILRSSSEGDGDVPNLPEYGHLVQGARRFLCDAAMTLVIFFSLPTVLAIVEAPLAAIVPPLAAGVLFAPLAFALRQVRRDLRTFSPAILLRAIRRCGLGYPVVAVAVVVAFAPAAAVAFGTMSRPVWVQIAIVGPLCVLPTFASARLLGSWLDTHRDSLGYLMLGREQMLSGPKDKKAVAEASAAPTQPRNLRRPAALEKQRAPQVKAAANKAASTRRKAVRNASALGAPAMGAPRPGQRPARPAKPPARAIEGRRPAAAAAKRAAKPAQPAQQPQRAAQRKATVEHVPATHAHLTDGPDLGSMPGAVVVKGSDRVRQGAASRRG